MTTDVVTVDINRAQELHETVCAASQTMERCFLLLGRALLEIQKGRFFTALGHETFESYLADPDLAFKRRAVFRHMRIAALFASLPSAISHLVTDDDVVAMRESRADIALPLMATAAPEDVPTIIAEAKTLAVSDLRQRARERTYGPLPDDRAWLEELGQAIIRRASKLAYDEAPLNLLDEICVRVMQGIERLRGRGE
jgi:hypothetical protein